MTLAVKARRICILIALAILLVVLIRLTVPGPEDRLVAIRGPIFGTSYRVLIYEPTAADADLADLIAAELQRLNDIFSTYLDDSELSRFNASTSTEPQAISEELGLVIASALDIGAASDGAFDITVGPLVRLWGFGRDGRQQFQPDATAIAAAQARVGQDHLHLDLANGTLRKAIPELEVDLAGIAKGYAVDRLSQLLYERDMPRHLVEIGGDLRVGLPGPQRSSWTIGVQRPQHEAALASQLIIALQEAAVATSGDYRNFQDLDGQRVSHLIDPHTGRPAAQPTASITVVMPSAMAADAWATALGVIDPDTALRLAQTHDLAVLLILRHDDGHFVKRASPAFTALAPMPEEGP